MTVHSFLPVEVAAEMEQDLLVPLIQLVLLTARQVRHYGIKPNDGVTGVIAEWGKLAGHILTEHPDDFGKPGDLARAKTIAQRAVRILHGYGRAAEAKAETVAVEHLGGPHGLGRALTEDEHDAISRAIGIAFITYAGYLDHGCGGLTPTRGA